jgi:hypothetical protein
MILLVNLYTFEHYPVAMPRQRADNVVRCIVQSMTHVSFIYKTTCSLVNKHVIAKGIYGIMMVNAE